MSDKPNIVFVGNYDIPLTGLSGGSRIFMELARRWRRWARLKVCADEHTINAMARYGITEVETHIIARAEQTPSDILKTPLTLARHAMSRTRQALAYVRTNSGIFMDCDYVYSLSDFLPDLMPAYEVKKKRSSIKWIAAFFLFAPSPWAADSPYKGPQRFRGALYWLMQRFTLSLVRRNADFVLVTSDPDVKRFVSSRIPSSRVVVVQGGVDVQPAQQYFFSGNVLPGDKKVYDACFLGRFHYQKGVIGLIDIWRIVCETKPDAKLAMIGVGPQEDEVKRKIEKYNLSGNIKLLGFLDGEPKHEIFKNSRIMVHPATYDSGGMAAAEGMAWRLPGVSYDLEALKTYYPKGMLKTRPEDMSAFADNIIKLLTDRKLYEKTANDAYSLIQEKWDWDKRAAVIFDAIFGATEEYRKSEVST